MSRTGRVRGILDIGCLTGFRGKGMNDPEVTMPNAVSNTNLLAYSKALEAAGQAIQLVMKVPAPLKSIADQLIRSASSVPANLAEGHGRSGRARQNRWRIAYASAKEVRDRKFLSFGSRLKQYLRPPQAPGRARTLSAAP